MVDNTKMEKIVALAKRRGFFYPGSDIYGGVANTYDYGPMGTLMMRNIRNAWFDVFVKLREDMVAIEASIISSHKIWDASGHTSGFADTMVDCKNCQLRKRADHLIEEYLEEHADELKRQEFAPENIEKAILENAFATRKVEGWSEQMQTEIIGLLHIPCPNCGKQTWSDVRRFNLMFPVHLGIVEGDQSLAYLRGETAQGMFTNFKNVINSTRVKVPFGIAQQGKSFRNEITLGNSIFRTIEFEQCEIEYFFDPEATQWEPLFNEWKAQMWQFVTRVLGISEANLRWREHDDAERSFYSKRTEDLEYQFPFGFKELWGIAYRTDYDLKQHMAYSRVDLSVTDPYTNKKYVPHVIEPAVSTSRLMLMALLDAYVEDGDRVLLKLHPNVAPYRVAVFPLLTNKPNLVERAASIFKSLQPHYMVVWDDRGNIGKRYAAQDEIGTPYCVTVDFQTLEDDTVTIRNRDTAQQERIAINEISQTLSNT